MNSNFKNNSKFYVWINVIVTESFETEFFFLISGKKLPHGLGINQIPIVSVDEVAMSDLDDISGVARYPMAKAHSKYQYWHCSK